MAPEENIIDLDALQPKALKLKFDGNVIDVKPPSVPQILQLSAFSDKAESLSTATNTDELKAVLDEMHRIIYDIIPELNGKQFNAMQLMKLSEIINDMATPPDTKALQKRGIEVGGGDSDAPKDPSTP